MISGPVIVWVPPERSYVPLELVPNAMVRLPVTVWVPPVCLNVLVPVYATCSAKSSGEPFSFTVTVPAESVYTLPGPVWSRIVRKVTFHEPPD